MNDTSTFLAEMLVGGELRIHLIGVAGSGMSGIAGLLLAMGHTVSGSDKVTTVEVRRLQGLGLEFHQPQNAANIHYADLVIYSSAIRPGNVEYDEAVRQGVSMVRRADALAAIMQCKKGVIVAGMHGKTTTSSMAAHVLRVGGVKPSHYVGAEIPILGANAHWDRDGEWFVAEGDESDGTLANYHTEHSIILNIEEEHLDYYDDLAAIEAVFGELMDQTRGKIFYCADDPHAARLCGVRPNAVSFGAAPGADYRFDGLRTADFQSRCEVYCRGERMGEIELNVPGRHNVSNAMSVVALASELGIPFAKIAEALAAFRGARRRFDIKYRSPGYLVVDDYAHHPSEIRATLATARGSGRARTVVLFQPHRYTRTVKLKDKFGVAFDDAQFVFISSIYPASEPPIPGVTGQTIADALAEHGHAGAKYLPDRVQMTLEAGRLLQPGDCLLSLGAGNIHEQGTWLARDLAAMEAMQAAMGEEGIIKLYEPLSKHTTLRVGGPAQFWAEPETEAGFARLAAHCHANGIPLMVMGRGSNLLVRDGGIRGVVVHLDRGEFHQLHVDGLRITAGAGVKLKELAQAAKNAGIAGLEWMEGIPGNVGGALRMNAGAMGGETFQNVISLRTVDSEGQIHDRLPSDLEIHYRGVPSLGRQYATSAVFEGKPGSADAIGKLMDDYAHKRWAIQPKEPSAGCTFKNPAEIPAGKLVEELGFKTARSGGAAVSALHGNFLINADHATATDVLALIERIQKAAQEKRSIALETEVQIVGETESFLK
ncbi:MAG: UDP-N-acetylmuramate--L-alanine ligase [Chthoniobacteraceae bacterium]|nr:UDP-N-acetylmuramate--L-alanine ligase [Chthoniobacteraceae bacterium]